MPENEIKSVLPALKAKKASTIFCGVCEYNTLDFANLETLAGRSFQKWTFHFNPKNEPDEKLLNDIGDLYYESFVSSVFPGYTKTGRSYFNKHFSEQTHRFTHRIDLKQKFKVKKKEQYFEKEVFIEYFDLFFFPGNILIYAFKCDFGDSTYDDITLMINHIRSRAPLEFSFIYDLLGEFNVGQETIRRDLIFGNKLKSFTLVEMGQALDPEEEDDLLYDLATCSPVGSASGKETYFQPSKDYKEVLAKENVVSVFDNWKAMCLFDSFTALFRQGAFNDFVWENAYFNLIFLHSVYVKHYLFLINRKFFLEEANKQQLEDDFYEFDHYFNFRQISYNFLPQIIYEKIRKGFNIDDELNQMQTSIARANAIEQSVQERRINKVLTIIAFLTVFSVILDASDLIDKLIFDSTVPYLFISLSLTVIIFVMISLLIFRRATRRRRS